MTLLWQPAKTGDGTLNGYRVFRDGKPFRDVKTTTLTIALPPLRTYSMTVAAVDTQGQASGMSNAVVIRADHAAPTTPAGSHRHGDVGERRRADVAAGDGLRRRARRLPRPAERHHLRPDERVRR